MPLVRVQRPTQDVAQPAQNYAFHASADAWYALTVDDNNELIANTHNRIWDTSALAWVAATGSLAGGASVEVVNFPSTQQVNLTGTATVVGIVNINNVAGTTVNPATEDTLSGIATNIATMLGNQTDGDQKSQIIGSAGLVIGQRTYANDTVNATTDQMLQVRANLMALNGTNSYRITGDANGLDVDVVRLPNFLTDESGSATNQILSDNVFLGAPVTVEVDHHEIHCGDSFCLSRTRDLGNAASDWLLVVVPNEAVKRHHMVIEFDAELEAQFNLYEGGDATFTGSSTLTWYNRERNSSLTTGIKTYTSASISTTGTLIFERHVGAGRFAGGSARGREEFVLKNNTKYLLQILNSTANNNYISWDLGHYIHPGV